jgi:hypothetical protein
MPLKTTDMALSISSAATVCEVSLVSMAARPRERRESADRRKRDWAIRGRETGIRSVGRPVKRRARRRRNSRLRNAIHTPDLMPCLTAGVKGQLRLFDKLDGGRRTTHGLSATSSPATCYHEWARCPTRLTRREKRGSVRGKREEKGKTKHARR